MRPWRRQEPFVHLADSVIRELSRVAEAHCYHGGDRHPRDQSDAQGESSPDAAGEDRPDEPQRPGQENPDSMTQIIHIDHGLK